MVELTSIYSCSVSMGYGWRHACEWRLCKMEAVCCSFTCCLMRFWEHCSNCSSLVSIVFPSFCRTFKNKMEHTNNKVTWQYVLVYSTWTATHHLPSWVSLLFLKNSWPVGPSGMKGYEGVWRGRKTWGRLRLIPTVSSTLGALGRLFWWLEWTRS